MTSRRIKISKYILEKTYATKESSGEMLNRVIHLLGVYSVYETDLRELTRYKILNNIQDFLICLQTEILFSNWSDDQNEFYYKKSCGLSNRND